MSTMMRLPLARLVLVAVALTACTDSQRITSPADGLAVSYAKAPPGGTATYTATDLGVLPGDQESYAWSANDAGYVVVQSNQYPSTGGIVGHWYICLLYTSDAADERSSVDLGGRRI